MTESEIKVLIEWDQIRKIILSELSVDRDFLMSDLRRHQKKDSANQPEVFFPDKEKDVKEIKKYIKAFSRVIKYYDENPP
jgi:hypothetical protein